MIFGKQSYDFNHILFVLLHILLLKLAFQNKLLVVIAVIVVFAWSPKCDLSFRY